jgi:hypothetical protein
MVHGVTYLLYYTFMSQWVTENSLLELDLSYNTRRFAPFFVKFDSLCDIYIPQNRISREKRKFAFVKLVIAKCFSFIFDVGGC